MLTIFSTLKPLGIPYADNVQRNAIQSWMALAAPCEILLLGDDEGTAEIAAEYGLRHEPNITRLNNKAPPLVSSVFARGQELASFDLVMYINSDIILLSDFIPTLERILEQRKNSSKPCLVVGQRHDLALKERLDFQNPHWEPLLRMDTRRRGQLSAPSAVDYFIFKKHNGNWLRGLPAFTIGIVHYDHWLIYRARSSGMDIIDATQGITAIQQEYENRKKYTFTFRHQISPIGRYHKFLMSPILPILNKGAHMNISTANLIYTPSGLRQKPLRFQLMRLKAILFTQEGVLLYPHSVLLRILNNINSKIKNGFWQIRREPLTRKRLKRILYKTGPNKYPQFKALFCIGQCLHRLLKTRFGLGK